MPGSRDGLQHTTGASGALGLFKNCSTGVVTQPCKHPKCAIILKRTCRSYLNKAGFFQKFSKIEIAPVVNFLFLTLAARPRSLVLCREAEGFVTAGSLRAVAAPGVETTSFCCDLRATRGTCPETSSTFCPSHAPATPQPLPNLAVSREACGPDLVTSLWAPGRAPPSVPTLRLSHPALNRLWPV